MLETFFDVKRRELPTSRGLVELPILYHDVSNLNAFFLVEHDKAVELLEGTGLIPTHLPGGKAFVGLAFFEYRDTSIGPYNEVGLAILCYPESERRQPSMLLDFLLPAERRGGGFYIVDLPVTTADANAAGRELWGYPKFVTKIPLSFSRQRFSGSVLAPRSDNAIFTLEGGMTAGPKVPGIDLVLYSIRGDEMVKTVVNVDAPMVTSLPRGMRLTVGDSKHRMANNLRHLGLDGARPVFVQNALSFHSRLNEGIAMATMT